MHDFGLISDSLEEWPNLLDSLGCCGKATAEMGTSAKV